MNNKSVIAAIVVLALIGATAVVLHHASANRKLGAPGVKTRPLTDSKNLEVVLPENLPGYQFKPEPQAQVVLDRLPKDTSFGQGFYTADDGFRAQVNVVLMGSDRSSIHKPEICLTSLGFVIDKNAARVEPVHIEKPFAYDLPVMHLVATLKTVDKSGNPLTVRGVYVYWFVDADRYTARHEERMWWMARDILLTGVLDRWAYISYFSYGLPGQEDQLFERTKKLIALSAPEFQLVPGAKLP